MCENPESLRDFTDDQLAALAELADAYQNSKISRRSLIRLAGAGILGGATGAGALTAAMETGSSESQLTAVDTDAVFLSEVSSAPADSDYVTDQAALYNVDGDPYWRDNGGTVIDLSGSIGNARGTVPPESVQEAIDQAAVGGGGMVRLDPTKRYTQDSSFPWNIKSNVTLDFNGAILYGSGDHPDKDMIHLWPKGRVMYPNIDLYDHKNGYFWGNPFKANVFTLDPKFNGPYFADGTTIRGGYTQAVGDTGTWLNCQITNSSGSENHMALVSIQSNFGVPPEPTSFREVSFNTGIHLNSTAPNTDGGFLNSLRIGGNWQDALTTIKQKGDTNYNQNNRHIFSGFIQPPDNGEDIWHIGQNTYSKENLLYGVIWDVNRSSFADGAAWTIDSSFNYSSESACRDNAIIAREIPPSFVENNSERRQFINDPITFTSTEV